MTVENALAFCYNIFMTGKEFQEKRKALGLTQEQLARELDVALSTVARWEDPEREIRNSTLLEIALGYLKAGRWRQLIGEQVRIEPLYGLDLHPETLFRIDEVTESSIKFTKLRRRNPVSLPLDSLSAPWYDEAEGFRATVERGELRETRDPSGVGVWRWWPQGGVGPIRKGRGTKK
jgi:transcriptional regulator with XRE-family HTH domain